MGMFDYLHCGYPLPLAGANELEFQTKDTPAQYMEVYELREDGSLWCTTLAGAHIESPLFAAMTGELRFYCYEEGREPEWIEFVALIAKGRLVHLEQVAPDPEYREGVEF